MRAPPVVWLAATALVQDAVVRARRHSGATPGPTRLSLALAAPVAGVSGWLVASSVTAFRRCRTTVDPTRADAASSLVTWGPNLLTRNPMYLGMAGLLLAHAVARRSPAALPPVLGFAWVIDRHQVPAEERALAARFGRAWEDYQRRVPRWLGIRPACVRPDGCRRTAVVGKR